MEVEDDHRHDGADLDNHQEKCQEVFGHLQLHELVHQDHMSGGRYGQPFGDAFDNAHKQGL